MKRLVLAIFLGFILVGCAEIPERIAQAPKGDLQLDKAVTNIDGNLGEQVRWGGTVLTVSDEEGQTWVEIQQHGLDRYGSPSLRESSMGRFLVNTEQLADELPVGMEVTVFGTLDDSFDGSIGREPYQFPVVNAEEHYQWGPAYAAAYPRFYGDYSDYRYPYHFGSYPYHGPFYPYAFTSNQYFHGFNYYPRNHHGPYYNHHGPYYYW